MAYFDLSVAAQTEFDAMVKIQYQSTGYRLRDTTQTRTNVIGTYVQFRKLNQIISNQLGFSQNVTTQNPTLSIPTAALVKWSCASGIDEIQDLTVNFDSKRELAMLCGMAIGRRSDQIIIDSFQVAAANSGTTGVVTIADGGTNASYAKMRNIVQFFEDNAVPIEMRYYAISGNNLRALLAADQIISRFYTSNDAAVSGNLNHRDLMGMNIRTIPTMLEGGLPKVGNSRYTYAWHKMATGMGIGQDLRTEINYIPQQTTWLVNSLLYAGAVVIDGLGLFQVNCDESVNP